MLPTEDNNGVCAKVEAEQSNTWQQGHQVGWNFDIHIRFPLAEMEADEMLEKVIRIEWENDLTIQHLEPQGAVTFVGGGRRYVLVKPQPQYVGHDYFSVKGIRKGGAPEDLLEPTITCSGGEDVPPPSSARVGRDGLTAQTARRSRQSRSTSAAPLPSANCNDDATYAFEDGVRPDGARITWHCADWVGYLCAPGGFGVVSAEDIAALLEACPFSCADGRCHNASAPVRLLPLTGARFEEVRTGVECGSDNLERGLFEASSATGGLQECANACAVQPGCSFFIYGVGSQAGKCWQETTADATCVEGWEEAEYNFYALLPPLPPAPPPAPALPGGASGAVGPADEDVHEMFELFDVDKSGTIDVSELDSILQQMGYSTEPEALDSIMQELDIDGSGGIDEAEFAQIVQASAAEPAPPPASTAEPEPTEAELREVFTQFDTDGDGMISGAELGTMLQLMGYDVQPQTLAEMLAQMDADGSSDLDFTEFRQLFTTAEAAAPVQDKLGANVTDSGGACTDDAAYAFEDGVRPDGARITWHCADWVGYRCSPGGFGVSTAQDVAALLEACPEACADGRCHNASAPVRLLPLTGARFEEVRTGVECASDNVARGLYGGASATGGLQECANACAVQQGCSFFIYGVGSQAGKCWQETTADATCVEGWQTGEYNFYALLPPLPPAPPPPGVPSPVGSPLRTPLLPPSPSPPPPPWAGTSVRAPPGPPAGLPPWAAGVDRTSLPSDDGGGDLRITPAALVAVAVGPLLGAFAIGAVVFLAYRRMSPGRRRVRLEEHEIPNTSMELVPAGGPVVPSPLLGMSQG